MTAHHACRLAVAVVVLGLAALSTPSHARQKPTPQEIAVLRADAERGDAAAQYWLGVRYANGRDVTRDHEEAVAWFRRAAEQGYAAAQYNLGVSYETGRGVPQDDGEASAWYHPGGRAREPGGAGQPRGHVRPRPRRPAERWRGDRVAAAGGAEQGDAVAQFNLGRMYADGRGVPSDDVTAHMWFNLAASRLTGYERDQAVEARDSLTPLMSRDLIDEAQRRAREWEAAHPRNP